MNNIIREIIDKNVTKEEKYKSLDQLSDDIQTAKDILDGKFQYCERCDDYYLTESFLKKKETKPSSVCVFQDPINSGGNDYADGYVDIIYKICPKGHKYEVSRKERIR